jgi:hypothetical protein
MAAEARMAWWCEKHGVRHEWMVLLGDHLCTKGCEKPMEPVAVLPAARAEALLRLEAAVEDDVMTAQTIGEQMDTEHGHYRTGVRMGIQSYRAAIRAARDGGET